MTIQVKKLVKISILVGIGIFAILIILDFKDAFTSFSTMKELITKTVSYTFAIIIFFEKILWRYIPCIQIPKLSKEYVGTIKYNVEGIVHNKDINILVKQTYLTINIKLKLMR